MSTDSRVRVIVANALIPMLAVWLAKSPAHAGQFPLWEAGVGVSALRLPDYRGSDQSRNYLLPLPYFVYRGKALQIDRRGATGVLFKSGSFETDISLALTNPVNSSSNRAREGMPNLRPAIEVGPRIRYLIIDDPRGDFDLRFEMPLRAAIAVSGFFQTSSIGLTLSPLLSADWRHVGPDRAWSIGVSGGPFFGDAAYHNYYYGVNPEFAMGDRPVYRASAGYGGTQLTLGGSRRYGKYWFGAFVRYYDLHGAVYADSPLVRQRSSLQAGLALSYVFATSDQMVEADD
jgi:MipA family protein